jgi:hypothetical protein
LDATHFGRVFDERVGHVGMYHFNVACGRQMGDSVGGRFVYQ